MKISVKVRGIAVLDGKLLCVQLKPRPDAKHDFWCLPGGNVDEGESLLDAFRREMVEELGTEPEIGRLLFVQQFTHGNKSYLDFHFHIKNPEDYQSVDLNKTTHGADEIEAIGFVDPANVRVLPEFLATENLEEFIASNQPVKFFS